jgi:enoyl-CoA hydratase/carnithine racemase
MGFTCCAKAGIIQYIQIKILKVIFIKKLYRGFIMNYKTILFEIKENVAVITLNRPDRLNALNFELAQDLISVFNECSNNPEIRAVILQGAGRAFSSGGDVKEMGESLSKGTNPAKFFEEPLKMINNSAIAITECPKPVIASIKGFANGAGFNLALCCDIRIASENTKFNQAFINIGLVPDTGGTYMLPRIIGLAKATELFFTGDFITANEAEKLGIINRAVPEDKLENEVWQLAQKFSRKPTLAIGKIKQLLRKTYFQDFKSQVELERELQIEIGKSEDFKEGIKAFFEKREAKFEGK